MKFMDDIFSEQYPNKIDPAEIIALLDKPEPPRHKWWQFWKKEVVDPATTMTYTWIEPITSRRMYWKLRLMEAWKWLIRAR